MSEQISRSNSMKESIWTNRDSNQFEEEEESPFRSSESEDSMQNLKEFEKFEIGKSIEPEEDAYKVPIENLIKQLT